MALDDDDLAPEDDFSPEDWLDALDGAVENFVTDVVESGYE